MDFRAKWGFRYCNGKVLVYEGNPSPLVPAWAVDIRELIAMFFVGVAALFFINRGEYGHAMTLLVGLLGYATGRTIPGTLAKQGGEAE